MHFPSSASTPSTKTAAVVSAQRVLWNGPLFGRLTKAGRSFLLRNGWDDIGSASIGSTFDLSRFGGVGNHDKTRTDWDNAPIAFAWPSKSGPQLSTDQDHPALVRPLPAHMTEVIDDKVYLQNLLENISGTEIMPPSMSVSSQEVVEAAKDDNDNNTLYFVKHRYGVQGRAVHVHTKQSLVEWYRKSKNTSDFVIQKEVEPALDETGKKFALRAHVLFFNSKVATSGEEDGANTFVAAIHKDVICHTHTSPYTRDAGNRSAHVSNAVAGAKKRRKKEKARQSTQDGIAPCATPSPCLISQLPETHPACKSFEQIKDCISVLSTAYIHYLLLSHPTISPSVTAFALVGADLLMSSEGAIKLCEVNSHPSLGWGTMSDVPVCVYSRLIEDTLSVLLLGNDWDETGFVALN